MLDVLGLPYTGSRTESLLLTTNKIMAKERLRQAGLPTPDWVGGRLIKPRPVVAVRGATTGRGFISDAPLFLHLLRGSSKGWEQGSIGMDDDAVMGNVAPPSLANVFGSEPHVPAAPVSPNGSSTAVSSLLRFWPVRTVPTCIRPTRSSSTALRSDKPRISHRAKWQADSFEYHHTPCRFDFDPSDAPLLDQLRRLAKQCWTLFASRLG